MDDGVSACGWSVEGKPEPSKATWFTPGGSSPAVSGGKMLGKRCEHDAPSLIAGVWGLVDRQL